MNTRTDTFQIRVGDVVLTYRVRASFAAQKWWQILNEKAKYPPLFRCPPRFRGFGNTSENLNICLQKLIQVCQQIERYDLAVLPANWQLWLSQIPSQEELNHLHKAFDFMRGEVVEPRPYFREAPAQVQEAIVELNERIHEMELLISQSESFPVASIKTEFLDSSRIPLSSEYLCEFTLHRPFGSLYLHYCQVGKQWTDVFEDKDEVATIENICPLKFISGEFDIRFGPEAYGRSIDELHTWLKSKGQNPLDPELALGWLIVADLIHPDVHTKELQQQLVKSIRPEHFLLSMDFCDLDSVSK